MVLGQARNPVVVRALFAKPAIDALDESILGGLASPNQLELNPELASALVERLSGEFRALVRPDRFRTAPKAAGPVRVRLTYCPKVPRSATRSMASL